MNEEELKVKEIIDRYSLVWLEFRDSLEELLSDIHYFDYDNLITSFVSQVRYTDS